MNFLVYFFFHDPLCLHVSNSVYIPNLQIPFLYSSMHAGITKQCTTIFLTLHSFMVIRKTFKLDTYVM